MQLKTHEELLQFVGKEVQFSHSYRRNVKNKAGLLYCERDRIYLLNNCIRGSEPEDKRWKRLGYKYSWIISNPLFLCRYEDHNYDISEILLIEKGLDYNKLEELLCS